MNDKLEITIKAKKLETILLTIVGVVMVYYGALYLQNSWWWLISIVLGLVVIYFYVEGFLHPKSLVLWSNKTELFLIFSKKKEIDAKQAEITTGEFYTSKYELAKLENIWKYRLKINHGTAREVIYVIYDTKKVELINLGEADLNLPTADLEKIITFFVNNAPFIKVGKP